MSKQSKVSPFGELDYQTLMFFNNKITNACASLGALFHLF